MKPAKQSDITVNVTTELRRVDFEDAQSRRAHVEAMFRMCVPAIIVLTGLYFMAMGIPGGRELVVGTAAYFAGACLLGTRIRTGGSPKRHHLISKRFSGA